MTVQFGWRRDWLLKAAAGSALIAALAGTLCFAIAVHGYGDYALDRRVILATMFGAFTLLLAAAAATFVAELLRPRAVVRVSDAGLHDRRLSPATIAWRDVAALSPLQRGAQVMIALQVDDPKRVPLADNPLWRVNRLAARITGAPELSVRVTGLDGDLFAVLHAIAAVQPAEAPPPDAPPPDPSA